MSNDDFSILEEGPPPDVDAALLVKQSRQEKKTAMGMIKHEVRNGSVLLCSESRTDAGNAKRFIDRYQHELLFVAPWRKWLVWDGRRWAVDHDVGVNQRAREFADSLWAEFVAVAKHLTGDDAREVLNSLRSFVQRTNANNGINNFLSLAKYDERVVCQVEELNADPYLLNVRNGTIELKTGELRPHDPSDRLTQLAPVDYDPTAACSKWLETMELILDGDVELIRYVQQLLGYSITGDTGEHILPIAYGDGANGKSTVWGSVSELLGDYATLANDDLLLGDRSNHPTEKASLYQLRFVAISEPEKGSSLRESRVKELTGDRTISARRMHEDFWTFQRTHTFWLSTNHLPKIDGTDEGIWRRVKLIPFKVRIKEKVKTVVKDFDRWLVRNEGPGILAWLVKGYLDYQTNGLIEPSCVTDATKQYRGDSDPLGDFLGEFCIVDYSAMVPASELFKVYSEVHKGNWKQPSFGKELATRFEKLRPDTGPFRKKTCYKGLRLRDDFDSESAHSQISSTNENTGCPQLPMVYGVPVRKLANSKDDLQKGGQPWANESGEVVV